LENPNGRRVDGEMILKLILGKYDVDMWTGFVWDMIRVQWRAVVSGKMNIRVF
jgi:hypothetical protein